MEKHVKSSLTSNSIAAMLLCQLSLALTPTVELTPQTKGIDIVASNVLNDADGLVSIKVRFGSSWGVDDPIEPEVDPATDTTDDTEPDAVPVDDTETVEDPQTAVDPVDDTEPAVDPADDTEPAVDPADDTEPAVDPADDTEPAVDPADDTEPAVDPADDTEPAVDPADDTDSTSDNNPDVLVLNIGVQIETESFSSLVGREMGILLEIKPNNMITGGKYQHMAFLYSEWDPFTGGQKENTFWGIYHERESDTPIPYITNIVDTFQNYGNLKTHQYFTSWAPIPVGNWIPFFSDTSEWHITSSGNAMSKQGGYAVFKLEKTLSGSDAITWSQNFFATDYDMHLTVVDFKKLQNAELADIFDPSLFNSMELGTYSSDFSQKYIAPDFSLTGHSASVAILALFTSLHFF